MVCVSEDELFSSMFETNLSIVIYLAHAISKQSKFDIIYPEGVGLFLNEFSTK